jgi:putative addiction module component (TIGR02574 family)
MSTTINTLLDTAMKLPSRDRARLASELIASLDDPPDDRVEEAWATEIDRRVAEVDSGSVKLLDWDSVRPRAKRKPRKR